MKLARAAVVIQAVCDVSVLLDLDQRHSRTDRVDRAGADRRHLACGRRNSYGELRRNGCRRQFHAARVGGDGRTGCSVANGYEPAIPSYVRNYELGVKTRRALRHERWRIGRINWPR